MEAQQVEETEDTKPGKKGGRERPVLTVNVGWEMYREIQEEVKELGGENVSNYIRSIVAGRHDMVLDMSAEAERRLSNLQTKIDVLEADKEKLEAKLYKRDGLAGIPGPVSKKEHNTQLSEEMEKFKLQWTYEHTLKELEALKIIHKDHLEKYADIEKELQQLRDLTTSDKRIGGFLETGGNVLSGILEKNPMLQQRVAENGLGALIGMGSPTQGALSGASLSAEEQQDLHFGKSFRQEFPEPQRYMMMIDLFRFLVANPGVVNSLIKGPTYQSFHQARMSQQPQATA